MGTRDWTTQYPYFAMYLQHTVSCQDVWRAQSSMTLYQSRGDRVPPVLQFTYRGLKKLLRKMMPNKTEASAARCKGIRWDVAWKSGLYTLTAMQATGAHGVWVGIKNCIVSEDELGLRSGSQPDLPGGFCESFFFHTKASSAKVKRKDDKWWCSKRREAAWALHGQHDCLGLQTAVRGSLSQASLGALHCLRQSPRTTSARDLAFEDASVSSTWDIYVGGAVGWDRLHTLVQSFFFSLQVGWIQSLVTIILIYAILGGHVVNPFCYSDFHLR